MRLPPQVLLVVLPALFVAGLLLALQLVHGHPMAPGAPPFETPF
ncbi:MAG TPA: hypothetical protein VH281_01340 [Gaiellaceae bacterium]|jgi:hypothetical protein